MLLASFMLVAVGAKSDIYSWVDEDGKKHFGDKVPKKYQNQANPVALSVHKPSSEEIKAAEDRYRESRKVTRRIERGRKAADLQRQLPVLPSRKAKTETAPKTQFQDEHEQKLAEYNESVKCFELCRVEIPKFPSGTTFDMSYCGHCKDLPKPKRDPD